MASYMNVANILLQQNFKACHFEVWLAQSYDLMNEGPRGSLESLLHMLSVLVYFVLYFSD